MKKLPYRISRALYTLSLLPRPHTTAVILAAGEGSRMREATGVAKQWMTLRGMTVLERSVAAFEHCPHIDEIVVVVPRGQGDRAAEILRKMGVCKVRAVVAGGKTRQHSAYNGARRASGKTKFIVIHDAARCLISSVDISAVVRAAYADGAATLGVPVTDTVKRVNQKGYIVETKDRRELWLAATPQAFAFPMYMAAAVSALRDGREVTDDNMLMESIGQRIKMVAPQGEALKLTTKRDLYLADAILSYREREGGKEDV